MRCIFMPENNLIGSEYYYFQLRQYVFYILLD